MYLGNIIAEVPATFQSDLIMSTPTFAAWRFRDIFRQDVLPVYGFDKCPVAQHTTRGQCQQVDAGTFSKQLTK